MKKLILILSLVLSACATPKGTDPERKWYDPEFRVMVAPTHSQRITMLVEHALRKTGRFHVVTRGEGFKAVIQEQDLVHREAPKRFNPAEKWSHMGKMYGVGAVIVIDQTYQSWVEGVTFQQVVQMLDANTGEVIATGYAEIDSASGGIAPAWDHAIQQMAASIPDEFEDKTMKYRGRAKDRREESIKHSEEMDRQLAAEVAQQKKDREQSYERQ